MALQSSIRDHIYLQNKLVEPVNKLSADSLVIKFCHKSTDFSVTLSHNLMLLSYGFQCPVDLNSWSCSRLGFVWWWPLFCFFLFLHLFPLIYYYIIPTLKGLSCEEATLCDCNTSNRLFIDVYRPNRLLSETKLFLVTSYYPSFFSLMALAFCSMPSDKAETPSQHNASI